MEVEVVAVVAVDAFAQIGGVLIGCAAVDGVCVGQGAVGPFVG